MHGHVVSSTRGREKGAEVDELGVALQVGMRSRGGGTLIESGENSGFVKGRNGRLKQHKYHKTLPNTKVISAITCSDWAHHVHSLTVPRRQNAQYVASLLRYFFYSQHPLPFVVSIYGENSVIRDYDVLLEQVICWSTVVKLFII